MTSFIFNSLSDVLAPFHYIFFPLGFYLTPSSGTFSFVSSVCLTFFFFSVYHEKHLSFSVLEEWFCVGDASCCLTLS